MPAYDYIFLIIEENHSFGQIINNPAAPYSNGLAKVYWLATNYYGTNHPSAPDYVAMVGGNMFGLDRRQALGGGLVAGERRRPHADREGLPVIGTTTTVVRSRRNVGTAPI